MKSQFAPRSRLGFLDIWRMALFFFVASIEAAFINFVAMVLPRDGLLMGTMSLLATNIMIVLPLAYLGMAVSGSIHSKFDEMIGRIAGICCVICLIACFAFTGTAMLAISAHLQFNLGVPLLPFLPFFLGGGFLVGSICMAFSFLDRILKEPNPARWTAGCI